MTTSPNVLLYSAIDGWRRQMAEHGRELLGAGLRVASSLRAAIDELDGMHVLEEELLHEEASHDLDRFQVLIDITALGVSGYQAADWLREHHRIDMGLSDHGRIMATLSFADTDQSAERLLGALRALIEAAPGMPAPPEVRIPPLEELQLPSVMPPREAFFGPTEDIPVGEAPGRIGAEQITPYPPGIPAVVPGERINQAVVDYLRSGLEAGMVLPDPADKSLDTIRVVRER
jgi:arginine/lysine/ornithine decarboxylase